MVKRTVPVLKIHTLPSLSQASYLILATTEDRYQDPWLLDEVHVRCKSEFGLNDRIQI
jgi:hypothetical protein